MNFKDYQTQNFHNESSNLSNLLLGLISELGQISQTLNEKKTLTKEDLEENIYNSLKYCSILSSHCNLCLDQIEKNSKDIIPPKNIKQLNINLFIQTALISKIIKKIILEKSELSLLKQSKIKESLCIMLSDFNTLSQTVGTNIHDIIQKNYEIPTNAMQKMEVK